MSVSLEETVNWPVRTLVFRTPTSSDTDLAALSNVVGSLVWVLLQRNIPHNLIISEGGRVVFVVPRQPEAALGEAEAFKCAFAEMGGLAVVYDDKVFQTVSEAQFVEVLQQVSLTAGQFTALKKELAAAIEVQPTSTTAAATASSSSSSSLSSASASAGAGQWRW